MNILKTPRRVSIRSLLLVLATVLLLLADIQSGGEVSAFGSKKKTKSNTKVTQKMKDQELQIEKLGLQKLKEMEKMESKATDGIIELSASDYMKYVIQNPRPYDVVVIFNVKSNCPHCEVVQSEYAQTVYSFVQERGINANFEKEKKIFFAVFYFSQKTEVQTVFKGHNFNTVPYLVVSAMDMKRPPRLESFYPEEDTWLISGNEVYDARMQINFVNNHLSTDVQIKYTFANIIYKNLIVMTFMAVFATLVNKMYSILLNQYTWMFVALFVYIVCTAGTVFSLQNGMPIFRFEKNEFGAIVISEYFQRGQRSQWAGEGYIMSVLAVIIGLSYLALNNVTSLADDKYQVRMSVYILVVFLFILQKLYLVAYRIKSPWYDPQFLPPDYYQRGSLMSDQGNNI